MNQRRPYQLDGICRLKEALCSSPSYRAGAFLWDDPGLGKTNQTIGLLDQLAIRDRIVVICPPSAVGAWEGEFAKWDGQRSVAMWPERADVTIVPDSRLLRSRGEIAALYPEVVVIDEHHRFKSPNAGRTDVLFGAGGLARVAPITIGLSGTPTPNDLSELWMPLVSMTPWVFGDRVPSYPEFQDRFTKGYQTQYGWRVTGNRNLDRLKEMVRPVAVRRRIGAVLQDLPPVTSWVHEHEISATGQRLTHATPLTKRMSDEQLLARVQSGDEHLATLRRNIGLMKARCAVNLMRDDGLLGYHKVVVFAHHIETIEALRDEIGDEAETLTLHGAVHIGKRTQMVNMFQTSPEPIVFLIQIVAGSTAITLTAARHVEIVEPSFVPADNVQAIRRCARFGQEHPVLARWHVLKGTLDEAIVRIVRKKADLTSQLFDETPDPALV